MCEICVEVGVCLLGFKKVLTKQFEIASSPGMMLDYKLKVEVTFKNLKVDLILFDTYVSDKLPP